LTVLQKKISWRIDSILYAMSLYQDEKTIYSDFNADAFNELTEKQFSNICKIIDGSMALKIYFWGVFRTAPLSYTI